MAKEIRGRTERVWEGGEKGEISPRHTESPRKLGQILKEEEAGRKGSLEQYMAAPGGMQERLVLAS